MDQPVMIRLLRDHPATLRGVTVNDSRARVCTAGCRAAAHPGQARTTTLRLGFGR